MLYEEKPVSEANVGDVLYYTTLMDNVVFLEISEITPEFAPNLTKFRFGGATLVFPINGKVKIARAAMVS